MAIIPGILPPSRENWQLIAWAWQFFPLLTAVQWLTPFYPSGKTSIESRFNLSGRWAWMAMEAPGSLVLLYIFVTLPKDLGIQSLPWGNWVMVTFYTVHYFYRAIASPLLNPSMSPIHLSVFLSATTWQVLNGISLGGWLSGYGPTTDMDWAGGLYRMEIGMVVMAWALLCNLFHEDDLREIRRAAGRRQKREMEEAKGKDKLGEKEEKKESSYYGSGGRTDKVYMLPKNGLFRWVLYPHYLCEWVEWAGFWMIGGLHCVPARSFLLNEIATMLPRALQGKQWYIEKFGKDKVGERKAVIPRLL
ncbi:hypothetical protein LTS18_004260 [Coniosporium uncinatum]|uniref:Uncharacterized protein n=1 Tax=Coniosporium uncinatum TaxID=93489 RepID=A0ACC3E0C7_9PEZI|nr:hypothetical protein LTS18_004260 [Coniosporium uncinatum]